ncbi:MAG: hypothetical protein ACRCXX_03985 [Cetobacterium sp.]|uniref:hypothetical protein n=1 Tax=Cetobacterium sp. TaxID=2071632 RepID=UPI003F30841F
MSNMLEEKCLEVANIISASKRIYASEVSDKMYSHGGITVWCNQLDDVPRQIEFEWDEYAEDGSIVMEFGKFIPVNYDTFSKIESMVEEVKKLITGEL